MKGYTLNYLKKHDNGLKTIFNNYKFVYYTLIFLFSVKIKKSSDFSWKISNII